MAKSTRRARLILAGVAVALVALAVPLWEPFWVWFAYESEVVVLNETSVKKYGNSWISDGPGRDYRTIRKKRIRWGPGEKFHVEDAVCKPCLDADHEAHYETAFIADHMTLEMMYLRCRCGECRD